MITSSGRLFLWPKNSFSEYVMEQQTRLKQSVKALQKTNPNTMKAMYETQQEIKKVKLYEHSMEIILPPMNIK